MNANAIILAELFAVAAMAGALDAIAGGGALITVPVLLLAGLPPLAAIATNKAQASVGNASAALFFAWRGFFTGHRALAIVAVAAACGSLGARFVSRVPRDVLVASVPIVLIGVAVYFAFDHPREVGEQRERLSPAAFTAFVLPPLAFYDGLFGPGTGMFMMIAFVTLRGFGLTEANAWTRLANTSSNLGAFATFFGSGAIEWRIAFVMAAGAVLGAQIGARLALRQGARIIRPVVVVFCCVLATKLLLDPGNPLRRAIGGLVP